MNLKKTIIEEFRELWGSYDKHKDTEELDLKLEAFLSQVIERVEKEGKIEILEELIAIWKPRDPLEPFTCNAILLELNVRLRELKDEPQENQYEREKSRKTNKI